MRLSDLSNNDPESTPELELELAAIERALAGEAPDADPELAELMALAAEIREQRPTPTESFSADLDRLAATGFRSGGRSWLESLRTRVSSLRPMRMALPAASAVTFLIALVVTVAVLNDGSSVRQSDESLRGVDKQLVPAQGASSESTGQETEDRAPAEAVVGERRLDVDAAAPEIIEIRRGGAFAPVPNGDAKIAPGQDNRRVDRDAFLTLSTQPDDVRETTDKAVAIVRGLGGIVASSQVSEGTDGATSSIQISLPTRNLDNALDQLTALGNVESLNEATVDITKPFVSARDKIRDARAERRSILDALSAATEPEMITELKRQANLARLEISRAKAEFDTVARQARLSTISLEILGDPDASEDWSISDALEDAKDVLRTAAGIALVTGAILLPLALLTLLGALALRAIRNTQRENTLNE